MISVEEYIRPKSVEETLMHLAETDKRMAVLAGGTSLLAQSDTDYELLIDIQAIGLDQIVIKSETIEIGALCRIQTLIDHPDLPPAIQEAARREGPNTIRQMGTIGGTLIVADWESELFATLLVFEAVVVWAKKSEMGEIPLSKFSRDMIEGGLVTAVRVTRNGRTSLNRVSRTPADKPIVAVVGRKDTGGKVLLAACGVDHQPILISSEEIDEIDPPGDFRGSTQYRREMLRTLAGRLLQELGQ